jgi:hypothetical protein
MTVLDIRGTHGSGKSYIVHQLINQEDKIGFICDNDVCIGTYVAGHDLAIVGSYDRVCGGCDGIKTADEICRRTRILSAEYKNVILEGILVAHTHRRYAELARDITLSSNQQYVFCFLTTPYEVCIQRVQDRRVARGQTAEFDLFHLTNDYERCHNRLPRKFQAEGFTVELLDWENPMPQILELLKRKETVN